MAVSVDFHSQLVSIMEVLANAAVAEICQLVEDGFSSLRLEISRSHRENRVLKSRLRVMEVRSGELPPPSLNVTCTKTDPHLREGRVQSSRAERPELVVMEQGAEPQLVVTRQGAEPQLFATEPQRVLIKKESEEEELSRCRQVEAHHSAPHSSSTGPAGAAPPPSLDPQTPAVVENQDRVGPEAQLEEQKPAKTRTLGQTCVPPELIHAGAGPHRVQESPELIHTGPGPHRDQESPELIHTGPGPHRDQESPELIHEGPGPHRDQESPELIRDEHQLDVGPDEEEALMKTLDSLKGLCAADWRGAEGGSAGVKQEEAGSVCVSSSSLDSSSFEELFSSPEVARSLTAPQRRSSARLRTLKDPLSSSFSHLCSSSTSDSAPVSSFSNTSSSCFTSSLPCRSERAFSCQQCSRVFSSCRDLLVHQRSHAGERIFSCPHCRKLFIHLHQLKTHQRVHTGEKPFGCSQCGRRFSQSSHIKRHMIVHTGERRFSCSLCGKRFAQSCSLKVHQAVHTGERPYSCSQCGKSFSVLGNLVRHQSVHSSK
uniref:zinc finger protein 768-like isoform X2 n=1 Tax=Semicossyphus pulcher TaxID=241346 RepID=UPI0037E85CCF